MTKNVKSDTKCEFFDVVYLNKNDINSVLEIEKNSFSHPWSKQLFLEELENPSSLCLKALSKDGNLFGYIMLRKIVDELHLLNIAVKKEFRNKGIAKALITEAEKRFMDLSCIVLEVRVSNKPAIELYKKLGFEQLYVRKRYYPDGEDALIMEKKICAQVELKTTKFL
ncbi:MAG TPA: ribosomal protein S18-alanine N-acetyltransferase [bacterium]|nr:ribosomal protein S18-alanine N-acetyltransferase [bacterium]